jgi:hypothetical protein
MVQVLEEYQRPKHPADYRASVERLLRFVPPAYLRGLDSVRLKDTVLRRKGGRPVRAGRVWTGMYWQGAKGRQPFIELNLNAIQGPIPDWMMKIGPFRDDIIGTTLYHEIGHHIHTTIAPDPRGREVVANIWRKRLKWDYARQRYWYLRPFKKQVLWFMRACEKMLHAFNTRRRAGQAATRK